MCGRYAVTTDPAKLAAEIDAINEVPEETVRESYNVAPTTTVMTVVQRHEHGSPENVAARRVRAMRWGLVPSWTKELGKGPLLFNARAETLAEKPAFRKSLPGKRCLIPMDGWFEWKAGPPGPNGKPTKIPFYMSPKDGTRLFMGGLWAAWRPPEARAAGRRLAVAVEHHDHHDRRGRAAAGGPSSDAADHADRVLGRVAGPRSRRRPDAVGATGPRAGGGDRNPRSGPVSESRRKQWSGTSRTGN